MKLESLTIALRNPYSEPGPNNPYEAKLSVSFDNNQMKVRLGQGVCKRILELAGGEIAAAAQVQINDFVKTALAISEQPLIEGDAE